MPVDTGVDVQGLLEGHNDLGLVKVETDSPSVISDPEMADHDRGQAGVEDVELDRGQGGVEDVDHRLDDLRLDDALGRPVDRFPAGPVMKTVVIEWTAGMRTGQRDMS